MGGTLGANYVFVVEFYIGGGIHMKSLVLYFDKAFNQGKLKNLNFWKVDQL